MDIFVKFKRALRSNLTPKSKVKYSAYDYHDRLEDMPDEFKPTNVPTLDKEGVGRQIKKLRLDADLTQKELAKIVGTHQPSISRWERGDFRRIQNLVMIADVFSKKLDVKFVPKG